MAEFATSSCLSVWPAGGQSSIQFVTVVCGPLFGRPVVITGHSDQAPSSLAASVTARIKPTPGLELTKYSSLSSILASSNS